MDIADASTEEAGAETVAQPEGDATERRPRRRRARRGRSPAREQGSRQPKSFNEENAAVEDLDGDVASEMSTSYDEDIDDEEGESDVVGAKAGFRNIPTWQEAVGIIVATNLESRAKRPGNGGSPRGRGGRGPRDNRGSGGGNRGGSRKRPGKRG